MLDYYKLIPMNTVSFAKQCALIAVDEVIDSHYYILSGIKPSIYNYWQEVKQYIIEI